MDWLNEQQEKNDSIPDTPSSPESVAALVIDECTHAHIFFVNLWILSGSFNHFVAGKRIQ